jgi:hypothetical protein
MECAGLEAVEEEILRLDISIDMHRPPLVERDHPPKHAKRNIHSLLPARENPSASVRGVEGANPLLSTRGLPFHDLGGHCRYVSGPVFPLLFHWLPASTLQRRDPSCLLFVASLLLAPPVASAGVAMHMCSRGTV